MQNDYGDLVETPEHMRQIAHAVAVAFLPDGIEPVYQGYLVEIPVR